MTRLKGSCLCGTVSFEVTSPVRGVGCCHCSKCRKASGTSGNAVFIVGADHFHWLHGADVGIRFSLSDGWEIVRCAQCGSPLPESFDGGQRMWVHAGLMDDPLDTSIVQHTYCSSAADWDCDAENAPHFDEGPA